MYKNCTYATLIFQKRKKPSNLLVTLILIKTVQAVFVHATAKYKIQIVVSVTKKRSTLQYLAHVKKAQNIRYYKYCLIFLSQHMLMLLTMLQMLL